MTGTSIADPLAQSYITVVHRLLDELTANIEKTARIAELEAELARRDAHTVNVAEVMAAARITDEDLEAEALAFDLPAFPAPFPNRFPIWDKWSDVPDGVVYESATGAATSCWRNRDGRRRLYFPADDREWASCNDEEQMAAIAPFVEVK